MQFIFYSFVKCNLITFLLILSHLTIGLTAFSSFLNNLDSTQQEDLANLQHSNLNQYSEANDRELTCQELKSCYDQAGFEAIRWLHRQLDDDQNGNVDMAESADFFKTDLNHSDANEKQLQFHGNDKHISVEDLWLYWIRSEVHNWTTENAVEWLHNSVELGQYEDSFRLNNVNGSAFPRLASLQSSFLPAVLGIKDPIHKQKIALKAMDLVLFGVPKTHNYFKDLLLVFSFLVAMLGCCYAVLQRKNSQNHLRKMLKDLEALQKAEQQLSSLQIELHQAKREQEATKTEKIRLEENLLKEGSYPNFYLRDQSSLPNVGDLNKICELEEELHHSKEHISRLEEAIDKKQWAPPQLLQYWLQLTHELELKNHNAKRQAAECQLLLAKEGCEKLKKKRGTFLGSFRVAHGTSIDDVDNRILQAKESLAEVTKDLQERLYRWRQIESIVKFPIQQNRGEVFLQSELYKQLIGNAKKTHPAISNSLHTDSMRRTGSEGTLIESEDSYNAPANPIGFSTVQQLFQHSFALMTLPTLDGNLYSHPALIPFGNDHYDDHHDRYCDACDQFPNPRYYATNQLTNVNNLKNSYLDSINKMNSITGTSNKLNYQITQGSSFKSKKKPNEVLKLLKRRYSENVLGSNMNISNLHYRLHPVNNEISKPTFSQIKNANMIERKAIQNGTCDEDTSTTSDDISERKPQFVLGDVIMKENTQKNGYKMNGKSNQENSFPKDNDELMNNCSQDLVNNFNGNLDHQSKSSTADLDSSKSSKKSKGYKFFSGLRKRGSKLYHASSQESH